MYVEETCTIITRVTAQYRTILRECEARKHYVPVMCSDECNNVESVLKHVQSYFALHSRWNKLHVHETRNARKSYLGTLIESTQWNKSRHVHSTASSSAQYGKY